MERRTDQALDRDRGLVVGRQDADVLPADAEKRPLRVEQAQRIDLALAECFLGSLECRAGAGLDLVADRPPTESNKKSPATNDPDPF